MASIAPIAPDGMRIRLPCCSAIACSRGSSASSTKALVDAIIIAPACCSAAGAHWSMARRPAASTTRSGSSSASWAGSPRNGIPGGRPARAAGASIVAIPMNSTGAERFAKRSPTPEPIAPQPMNTVRTGPFAFACIACPARLPSQSCTIGGRDQAKEDARLASSEWRVVQPYSPLAPRYSHISLRHGVAHLHGELLRPKSEVVDLHLEVGGERRARQAERERGGETAAHENCELHFSAFCSALRQPCSG